MKVCLIRPPQLSDSKGVSPTPSPPLGLAFIAGAIKHKGYIVEVIDAIGENPNQYTPISFSLNTKKDTSSIDSLVTRGLNFEEIAQRIPECTTVIGFSCMFTNNWVADRSLIDYIGNCFPNAIIIAGGEHISSRPELWIKQTQRLDICVLGEGEETVVALLEAIEKKRDFSDVNGIVYRKNRTSEVIHTPRRVRVVDIEQIPLPAWEYFPVRNYAKYQLHFGVTQRDSLPIMATRGCPFSCTFCSSPQMWGTRYYMRTPQSVADEIENLISTYEVTNFDFFDLTAIIKPEWIIEFSNEIFKRKLDITWQIPAGTRSEAITEEVAYHLFRSGCRNITYAPESGSQRMLKLIKKKVNIPNMLKSIRYSHKQGMEILVNIIIALPGERHIDIWKTLWFLIRCSFAGVNDISLSPYQSYPGSALFNELEKEGKVDLSTDDYFIEQAFITSFFKTKFYNDKINENWYRFYNVLLVFTFLISIFAFRPIKILQSIKNLIVGKHKSRWERGIGKIIENQKNYFRGIINRTEQSKLP